MRPLDMRRIALAGQERRRFGERQADDRRIGADQPHDKGPGEALNGVAAGLDRKSTRLNSSHI